jgi:hypothetical protein
MDRSKPFRRLLPVGILSAAGFAGCASAPAYRPVVTSQAPVRPLAAADASANSSSVPATQPPSPPVAPPAAVPVTPPVDGSGVTLMPAPPSQSVSEPAAPGGPAPALSAPGPNDVQPYLSSPMGVLQTPLTPPSAPPAAPSEGGQPLLAPQLPADTSLSAPAPPSVAVKVDAAVGTDGGAAGAAEKPLPGKKPKPTKPAEPPLSPLARLRKRFHSITHPPKKDPDQKSVLADPHGTATEVAHSVSGYRVPLPNGEIAVKVATPPIHGLYASDDVDNPRPIASDVKTARVEPSAPQSVEIAPAPVTSAAAATKPVADTEIEQWPYSAPTTTTARPNPAPGDSTEDFTAISADDYQAGVTKIEHANAAPIIEPLSRPTPTPPPAPQQAQSDDSAPPEASFLPGPAAPPPAPAVAAPAPVAAMSAPVAAAPVSVESQKPVLVVIPQAVPSTPPPVAIPQTVPAATTDRVAEPAQSNSAEGSHQSAGAGEAKSLRDLTSSAPVSAAAWSPTQGQGQAIEPTSASNPGSVSNLGEPNPIDLNTNSGGTFNPGWTLPQSTLEGIRTAPSAAQPAPATPSSPPVTYSPVTYPPVTSGRYGQPAWMTARVNPNINMVQPTRPAPAVLPPAASLPAPQTISAR